MKADIGSLKQEKAQLEADIKHTREEMAHEISIIVPSVRESIKQWQEELQVGHDEALLEMRRLRGETIEVGKEIRQYEQTVKTNACLNNLNALLQGDEDIEAKQVKFIVLLVLRSVATWLERTQGHNAQYGLLLFVNQLIAEMGKWKA